MDTPSDGRVYSRTARGMDGWTAQSEEELHIIAKIQKHPATFNIVLLLPELAESCEPLYRMRVCVLLLTT